MSDEKPLNLDAYIRDELDAYEFRGDEGDYTPSDADRVLLEDFVQGLIADDAFVSLVATHSDNVIAALRAELAAKEKSCKLLVGGWEELAAELSASKAENERLELLRRTEYERAEAYKNHGPMRERIAELTADRDALAEKLKGCEALLRRWMTTQPTNAPVEWRALVTATQSALAVEKKL